MHEQWKKFTTTLQGNMSKFNSQCSTCWWSGTVRVQEHLKGHDWNIIETMISIFSSFKMSPNLKAVNYWLYFRGIWPPVISGIPSQRASQYATSISISWHCHELWIYHAVILSQPFISILGRGRYQKPEVNTYEENATETTSSISLMAILRPQHWINK